MGHRPRPLALLLLAALFAVALSRQADSSAHLAQAQSPAPEVWFAPYPTAIGPPEHLGFGSPDYMDLFEDDAPWLTARDRVDVFQFYWEWFLEAPEEDVIHAVQFLTAQEIDITIEVPALEWQDVGGPNQCGVGAEGWVDDHVEYTLHALDLVAEAGGTVRALTMQEPYSAASPTSSVPYPTSCWWSVEQIAEHVADYIAEVRLSYPDAVWGTTESDHIRPAEFAAWADAFEQAVGEPLQYMHYDVDWSFRSDWVPDALATEQLMRARGIPFGMIYNGIFTDTSDAMWIGNAIDHFAQYEGEGGGQPDQVKFQSWHKHPQHVLPETDPTAHTALINRYFDARTEVAVSVGEASASSRVATVTASSDGSPVAGAEVEVRFAVADGPGVEATYRIEGAVPEGATRAVVGYRVNQECNCNFSESHFTFYEGTFRQANANGVFNGQNRIPNPSFANGLQPWVPQGLSQYLVADGVEPNRLRVDAGASFFESAMVNSGPTNGQLTAGRRFEATFRAKVDPRSIGSGYFTVVFVNDEGGPWVEVTRFRLPIEPEIHAATGVTGQNGIAQVTLPNLPPARLRVDAFVAGAPARVPGFSPVVSAGALAPDAASLLPTQIAAGAQQQQLRLLGGRFSWDSQVSWNGNPRPTTFVSATELRFTALAGDLAAAGPHQVTVSTPSPGGGSDSIAYTLLPRTLTISGAAAAQEGSPYTLNLAASYPGANTITSWQITWGDGAVQTVTGSPNSVQHTFADGPVTRTITATATDADGTWPASAPVVVAVANVAPSITLSGHASVAEGATYNLVLSASDTGPETRAGWTVDWGDGTDPVELPGSATSASHVFANGPATPTIKAWLTDEDGTFGPQSKSITVTNVSPTVTAAGPSQAVAGETYTVTLGVSDPGAESPVSWHIDWGDGSSDTLSPGETSATHVYAVGLQTRTVTATYTDGDGAWPATSFQVQVLNSPPPLSVSGTGSVAEGGLYTLGLSSGVGFISSWTIDWGDGAVEVVEGDPSSATHTYGDGPLTHQVVASATDGVSTWDAAPHLVSVADVAPAVSVTAPAQVDEGGQFAITFAASDPGADPVTGWSIDWGDGTPAVELPATATGATHTYADGPAEHAIVVSALNGDGTFPSAPLPVEVRDVEPVVSAIGPADVAEGSTYTVTLSATDPGNDPTSWRIDWGDGSIDDVPAGATSASHTYTDGPEVHTVEVTALQGADEFPAGAWDVDVADVAPTITLDAPASVREQNPAEVSFSLTDPGADSIASWSIDWGDGSPSEALPPGATDATHAYAMGGATRTVTVTAMNEDGSFSEVAMIAVLPGPALIISGASTITQGEVYSLSLLANPSILTGWSIQWGDGKTSSVPGDVTTTGHTYSASGVRTVSASGTDSFGTWHAASITVTVLPPPPAVSMTAPATARAGEQVVVDLDFEGFGEANLGWEIDWGDGTTGELAGSAGSASHVYDDPGSYSINASAMTAGGTIPAEPAAIEVSPAPLLTFEMEPAGSIVGTAFAAAPAVLFEDELADPGVPLLVELSVESGPGALSCAHGRVAQLVAGAAEFPGCTLSQPGEHVLRTTVLGTTASALSEPFTMSAATGAHGLLRVTTNPPTAAQIFVNGVPADTWGLDWAKVPPGEYVITVSDMVGLVTPTPQAVTVTEGGTTTVEMLFASNGVLRVVTSPPLPATLFVDGVPVNDWGYWSDVAPGVRNICFGEVVGFESPPCQLVVIDPGELEVVTGTFTADPEAAGPETHGLLRVVTGPPSEVEIRINGLPRARWGLDWMKLSAGAYVLSFGGYPGLVSPPPTVITVAEGQTTAVTADVAVLATLRVITSPPAPSTIFIDRLPRDDWGVWMYVEPGEHEVCFGAVEGFATPPCQSIVLTSGGSYVVTGEIDP